MRLSRDQLLVEIRRALERDRDPYEAEAMMIEVEKRLKHICLSCHRGLWWMKDDDVCQSCEEAPKSKAFAALKAMKNTKVSL